MNPVVFTHYGRAEPQGSSSGFAVGKRVVITSANKKLKPFRKALAVTAAQAVGDQPAFGKHVPVGIAITFRFVRPKTAPRSRKGCVVKPDLDKLVRGVCDALTGIVWHDDAQVVHITTSKVYREEESVTVVVREEFQA